MTPQVDRKHITVFKRRSVLGPNHPLRVDDWPAFWAKRSALSLAAIHAELRPLVIRYYRTRGQEQVPR